MVVQLSAWARVGHDELARGQPRDRRRLDVQVARRHVDDHALAVSLRGFVGPDFAIVE